MSLAALLLKVYLFFENIYYKVMDGLASVRLPVYRFFVNPIENRKLPSFPFALLVLVVIIVALFALFQGPAVGRSATIIVSGPNGELLSGAQVTLSLAGKKIASAETTFGSVYFNDLPREVLSLKAEKESYLLYADKLESGQKKLEIKLSLTEEALRQQISQPTPAAVNWKNKFGLFSPE